MRTGARLGRRYRGFLLQPATLFALAAFILLLLAAVRDPSGLLVSDHPADVRTPLYLAAALVGSSYIWWSALQGLRERDFTADIPVSLATIASLLIGQFSAAAVVAVMLLVGGLLEDFVAARASNALESLAALLPDQVTVRRGGREVAVHIDDVEPGDVVLVRSGERIAVDGQVIGGTGTVNQAAITGESLAVDKARGDTVYAGTLNEVGALEIRTASVGTETTLGQIRRLINEAQGQKAPIERLLDRYANLYTPAAILLGILVWVVTRDPLRAITILIVFCPCVMVLATPTALVASIGNAALSGSLVKRGATIEALARVDAVAFDKTGTLTTGEPVVAEVRPLNGCTASELLSLAAAAEKLSEHPLGRAIVAAADERGLHVRDPEELEVLPGLGVRALVEDRELLLGRPRLLADRGLVIPDPAFEQADALAARGQTVIMVAHEGSVIGLLALQDALRPDAGALSRQLGALGLRLALVTGDNWGTAERVARQLGISEVHAEVLPAEKAEIVRRLQDEGRNLVFVGDGVNDGPALAAADVGVAMGRGGTDAAVETAQVALLSDDLARLPHLLGLSRRAVRAIRQNLVFSVGVLAVAVALATVGILNPVTGALLHELSSLPVIANSARLIGVREARLG